MNESTTTQKSTLNPMKEEKPTSTEALAVKIKRVRVRQQTNIQTGETPIRKP